MFLVFPWVLLLFLVFVGFSIVLLLNGECPISLFRGPPGVRGAPYDPRQSWTHLGMIFGRSWPHLRTIFGRQQSLEHTMLSEHVLFRRSTQWTDYLKHKEIKTTNYKVNVHRIVFPNCWPPGEEFEHFGPQIQILHEISSLEPAGKLWNLESRPKSGRNEVIELQLVHGVSLLKGAKSENWAEFIRSTWHLT